MVAPALRHANLAAMFLAQAARFGTRAVWLRKTAGHYQPIGWNEAAECIRACATALLDVGVQVGDRIAILSENRPEWAVVDFAALACGALTVPIYATDTPAELQFIVRHSGASILFLSSDIQLRKWAAIRHDVLSLRHVIVFDGVATAEGGPPTLSFSVWLERGRRLLPAHSATLSSRVTMLTATHPATIIYTSGTTGVRKGVVLTHGNFLSNCAAIDRVLSITAEDTHLSMLPLSHVFERLAGHYLMIHQGATIAYAESLETVPQNLLEVRPTVTCAVPRLYEKIYAKVLEASQCGPRLKRWLARWAIGVGRQYAALHIARRPLPWPLRLQGALARRLLGAALRRQLGGRLRFFVSGSAPLAVEIAAFFDAMGIVILEGYGLTETSPVITVNTLTHRALGTVGRPLPGVEVKILNDGEITTRGPHVMKEYFNDPKVTREVLQDGWLATGDIGRLDAEGFLTITDRKKDLIITAGGKNVAPQKLENLLKTDPLINQVFVYGDRRPYLVALIVPHLACLAELAKEHRIPHESAAELVRHPQIQQLLYQRVQHLCRDLPTYEQIKYCALLDHELTAEAGEVTPTLKIRRQIVCQRYQNLLESLYTQAVHHG